MSQDSIYQFPNTILFGTGDDPSGSGREGNKGGGKSKASKKKPAAKKK